MLIYVDDIIKVSSSLTTSDKFIQQLTKEFAVKDLGSLDYILGIEVKHQQGGILLLQRGYSLHKWSFKKSPYGQL